MNQAPTKSTEKPAARRNQSPSGAGAVDRILFVTGELCDDSFGHGALRLARELRRRGKDVGLLCGGGELVGEFRGIGIEPMLAPGFHTPARAKRPPRRVLEQVRGFGPQLIHLFGRSLAACGQRLSSKLDRPYVLTVLTLPPGRGRRLRGNWSRGSILVVSEELREQLVNRGRIPKAVIGVVPFGIALDEFERYRDTDGHDRIPVVGMVGPLTHERGGEVFLHAARQILDEGRTAEFLLAGSGPERPRLRRLVHRLELEQSVTMVHQFADYRQMIAVLDVCVFPALEEGLSLNIIESMACCKPVVATGIGAVYSIIADGTTGLLATRGDPGALAEKILRLIDDRALASRIAQAAYEQVRERFSVRASVEKLLAFYSDCLARVETP